MNVVVVEIAESLLRAAIFRNDPEPTVVRWVTCDWPEDARIVDIRPDPTKFGIWLLKVTSAAFEDVPEGYHIPTVSPTLTEHTLTFDDAYAAEP